MKAMTTSVAAHTAVSEFTSGSGDTIRSEHVWIQCKGTCEQDEPDLRACLVEQGDRTPQIGYEIAVTGFGGAVQCVWFAARIFAQHTAKGKKRGGEQTFTFEVYYAKSETKTSQVLSRKTYGPAQCTLGDLRVGRKTVANSYSHGWVFFVPTELPTAELMSGSRSAGAATSE